MDINGSQPLEIDGCKEIFLGQVVNDKDEAYNLYQQYAFRTGFSGRELYYDNERKITRFKEFYCSKEGFKNNEFEDEMAYERVESRTNCKAMVRFIVSKEGVWKITKLVLDHNHEFVPPEQKHLLRSMRNMSNVKGGLIKSMVNVGMRVTNIWSYLGEEAGGYINLDITLNEVHNYVYNEKLKVLWSLNMLRKGMNDNEVVDWKIYIPISNCLKIC